MKALVEMNVTFSTRKLTNRMEVDHTILGHLSKIGMPQELSERNKLGRLPIIANPI